MKTKGAKHKIDKMHKSSRERLAETTKTATSKLKNVGKNLHERIESTTHNLSLGRRHKCSNSNISEYDAERSQTAPPNDELFQSISFYSPLCSKTNNCMNINMVESSYEIPKNLRSISSDVNFTADGAEAMPPYPPSYDEIMKEDGRSDDLAGASALPSIKKRETRNDDTKRSDDIEIKPKEMVPQPAARTKREAVTTEKDHARKRTESPSSTSSAEDEHPACPKFPPPVLKEGIYGKIKPKLDKDNLSSTSVSAPVRTKRRKDYEQANIRPKVSSSVESTRATIDSDEYRTTEGDRFPKIFSRDLSEDFTDKVRLEEKQIPIPSRSESWSYYDANDEQSDGSSTPEPIYANDGASRLSGVNPSEPVYGVLYNLESPESTLLTPEAAARKSQYEAKLQRTSGKAGCSTDILKEFDPLDVNAFDKIFPNKSNELILLESLLGEETYGPASNNNNFEYHSTEPSDDDDSTNEIPPTPQRLDSLPEIPVEVTKRDKKKSKSKTEGEEERKTVIIHQNLSLRSDSLENIVNETNIEQFLSQTENKSSNVDNIDLSRPSASKSRWFLGNIDASKKATTSSTGDSNNEKIINKIDDANVPKNDKCPPPYSEVIAEIESAALKPTTATVSDKRSTSSKSSMKSMFSNVMNKMEGIKRKASFRSQGGKAEPKTIIEMVPRPCLTQRLILHEGHLIRLPTGVVEDILKEIHSRKAYIRDKKFQAYCDKDFKTPKENIPLEFITTIQCVSNHKFTNHSVDMYCFEITTAIPKSGINNLSNPNMVMSSNNSGNTKSQRACHLYAVAKESERFIWMQKLLDSVTDVFPSGFSCKFYRAGWCYLKVRLIINIQNSFNSRIYYALPNISELHNIAMVWCLDSFTEAKTSITFLQLSGFESRMHGFEKGTVYCT